MQVTRQRSARGPDPGRTGVKAAAPRRRCAREETWDDLLAGADDDAALPELSPNDAINIEYTDGTTGAPKGATLSHRTRDRFRCADAARPAAPFGRARRRDRRALPGLRLRQRDHLTAGAPLARWSGQACSDPYRARARRGSARCAGAHRKALGRDRGGSRPSGPLGPTLAMLPRRATTRTSARCGGWRSLSSPRRHGSSSDRARAAP
jgi:hypothetical protein